MQKQIKIKAKDGYTLYGLLNTTNKKSDTLAILVHGLTSSINDHAFYNAAQLLPKKGVDVFRIDLYGGEPGSRKLTESTISTHAQDLNSFVSYFREKYKTIAVVGHSLGGTTIFNSDLSKVDNIVLWDSAYLENKNPDWVKRVKVNGKDYHLLSWGIESLMSPEMYQEWQGFEGEKAVAILSKISKPLKAIVAGKGILVEGNRKYADIVKGPKQFTVIKNATHNFIEEGVLEVLLKETLEWIKKHRKK